MVSLLLNQLSSPYDQMVCFLVPVAKPLIQFGAWLSLVERLVRDQEAGGSNPLAPTNSFNNLQVSKEVNRVPKERIWVGDWVGGPSLSRLAQDRLRKVFQPLAKNSLMKVLVAEPNG